MNIRRHIPDHAVTTIPVLALLFAVHYFLLRDDPAAGAEPRHLPIAELIAANEPAAVANLEGGLARLEPADADRQQRIQALFDSGDYRRLRTELLEHAAAAVARADRAGLADSLLLLGEVAIEQQELAAAETFLQEALDLAVERDDAPGAARAYRLLGRLNIRARELARRAANTYDELWQARNAIARGLLHGVDARLRRVIDDNLAIRRYGAAADGWEALAALHQRQHDGYQASLARIEAIRLFASTGRSAQVNRLIEELDRDQLPADAVDAVRNEADALFARYLEDRLRAAEAHDYRVLYYRHLRQGDVETAWRYRIQSSRKMASASERAMFQRQAEIIAVLYNSNFAMARARRFLDAAGRIYDQLGAIEQREQTRVQQSLIY